MGRACLLSLAALILASAAGCGSVGERTMTVGGVEVVVPDGQPRRETMIAASRASSEKTGFTQEWNDCMADQIGNVRGLGSRL